MKQNCVGGGDNIRSFRSWKPHPGGVYTVRRVLGTGAVVSGAPSLFGLEHEYIIINLVAFRMEENKCENTQQ